jgi:hypothetical protein
MSCDRRTGSSRIGSGIGTAMLGTGPNTGTAADLQPTTGWDALTITADAPYQLAVLPDRVAGVRSAERSTVKR